MNGTRWVGVLAALALAGTAGCGGRHDDAQAAVVQEQAVIPEGSDSAVVVDEEDWMVDVPPEENALERARDHFRRAEMRESAAELRRAATHIDQLRQRVDGPAYDQGARAVQALQAVAGKLEAGTPVPHREMDAVLLQGHQSLVAEHRAIAANARQVRREEVREVQGEQAERRTFRALGDEVTAAAGHLERAAALAGQRDDPQIASLLREARDLKARMDQGDEAAADQSQRLLDQMGAASERLVVQMEQ